MSVVYESAEVTLHHGDCLDVLATLPDCSVDSVVTDPPYGLANTSSAQVVETITRWINGERDYLPTGAGFMGKSWDAFVPPVAVWDECLRVLKPGGHLLAFAGTRTDDLMGLSIRLAGFDIRDGIAWLHAQGFPKGGIDEQGRGTALKPAFEPVVVARKPLTGTLAANLDTHSTGALNIDACRIDGQAAETGRFPANVTMDEVAAAALDGQSGILTSGRIEPHHVFQVKDSGIYGRFGTDRHAVSYGDSGGASRFFYTSKADANERPVVDGMFHPTVKPLDLMRWLIRLVTPRGGTVLEPFAGSGTTLEAAVLEGFRAIGIEREADYIPLITHRLDKPHTVGLDLFGDAA